MPLNNSRYRALFMLVSAQRIGFTTGHAVHFLDERFRSLFQQKGLIQRCTETWYLSPTSCFPLLIIHGDAKRAMR